MVERVVSSHKQPGCGGYCKGVKMKKLSYWKVFLKFLTSFVEVFIAGLGVRYTGNLNLFLLVPVFEALRNYLKHI